MRQRVDPLDATAEGAERRLVGGVLRARGIEVDRRAGEVRQFARFHRIRNRTRECKDGHGRIIANWRNVDEGDLHLEVVVVTKRRLQ